MTDKLPLKSEDFHNRLDLLEESLTKQGGVISAKELIAVFDRGVKCLAHDCRFLVFPDRCGFREPFLRFGRCMYYNSTLTHEEVFPTYAEDNPKIPANKDE